MIEERDWIEPATTRDFPRYPDGPRDDGIEARVIAAFVVDRQGLVEYRTVSLLPPTAPPEFFKSVCTFLRHAKFVWLAHGATRGLLVMPFAFTLGNYKISRPLPPAPNLKKIQEELAHLTPAELQERIETSPHCD